MALVPMITFYLKKLFTFWQKEKESNLFQKHDIILALIIQIHKMFLYENVHESIEYFFFKIGMIHIIS